MLMKSILSSILLVLILLLPTYVFSQVNTEIVVKEVSGTGFDTDVIKSREKAINDAKINALRRAGIEENINAYTDYYQAEVDESYQEMFNSQVFIDIKGIVKNIEIVSQIKEFVEGDNVKTVVTVNCNVIKLNSKPDLMYKASIEGIMPAYYANDFLSFSVKPSMDSWLNIFCIPKSEENAYSLFPNEAEATFLLKSDVKYKFPISVDYAQSLDGLTQQTDRLIFVLTKEQYPFYKAITYTNILEWIFDIPADKRIVESFAVTIFPEVVTNDK